MVLGPGPISHSMFERETRNCPFTGDVYLQGVRFGE